MINNNLDHVQRAQRRERGEERERKMQKSTLTLSLEKKKTMMASLIGSELGRLSYNNKYKNSNSNNSKLLEVFFIFLLGIGLKVVAASVKQIQRFKRLPQSMTKNWITTREGKQK